ncbi:hypothetical protein GCM10009857_00350 [Agromyces soli]
MADGLALGVGIGPGPRLEGEDAHGAVVERRVRARRAACAHRLASSSRRAVRASKHILGSGRREDAARTACVRHPAALEASGTGPEPRTLYDDAGFDRRAEPATMELAAIARATPGSRVRPARNESRGFRE